MYTIYIDVPHDFQYDWRNSMGGVTGDIVLSKQLNANVKFICNSMAMISEGDCYSATFDDEKEALVWLLKNNFKQVDKVKVEQYLSKKDLKVVGPKIPTYIMKQMGNWPLDC